MTLSYDNVEAAFLSKITEYEFLQMPERNRTAIVDNYLSRAASVFSDVCVYDLSKRDNTARIFADNFDEGDIDEIVDILSDGMVVQWFKQYLNNQDKFQIALSTRDYTLSSTAESLKQVNAAYKDTLDEFKQRCYRYSVRHADLTTLHM